MSARRSGAALAIAATLTVAACSPEAPLTDEQKLDRISTMVAEIEDRFPAVGTITVDEVGRLLEKDSVVLVDVRDQRERDVSTIPGAITAEEYEADPARYADVAVVAYCTIGHRSSVYAERLAGAGQEVFNLAGSILAWTHAGAPLVAAEGPTNRVHVYGSDWDLAPSRFEATY